MGMPHDKSFDKLTFITASLFSFLSFYVIRLKITKLTTKETVPPPPPPNFLIFSYRCDRE